MRRIFLIIGGIVVAGLVLVFALLLPNTPQRAAQPTAPAATAAPLATAVPTPTAIPATAAADTPLPPTSLPATATTLPTNTPQAEAAQGIAAPTAATFMPNLPNETASINKLFTGVLGFSDVQTHQVVRTSGDRVYIFAPEIYKNYLLALRATSVGTPAGFSEADQANRPVEGSAAWSLDAAIDGNDVVHILSIAEAGPVVYRTFDTRTDRWGTATTISTSPWPNRNSGLRQGSAGVSLVLSADGVAHVAYSKTEGDKRRIYYNSNQGGGWNNEALIDDQPDKDNSHAVLAFAPDGSLYLAWMADGDNQANKAALRVRARRGTSWGAASQVDDNIFRNNQYAIDQGPSLLVTADGTVHLAYIAPYEQVQGAGFQYGRVRYTSSSDGQNWVSADPPVLYTHNPSLATDGRGNLLLFGHREAWKASGCASMLATTRLAGGNWGSWRTLADGCYDSSVSVKWAQSFWNNPAVIDLIYWTEKGPNGESDYNQLYYAEIRSAVEAINRLPEP